MQRRVRRAVAILRLLFLVIVHPDAFGAHRLPLHRVEGLSRDRLLAILQLSKFYVPGGGYARYLFALLGSFRMLLH